MSPTVQITSEQLKVIIEDEMKTNQGSRAVEKQLDGEEVRNPDNTGSVLSTVLNTTNNKFEHECLHEVVRLLNAHSNRQSTHDCVPGHKYSIPGLPSTMFLAHQVSATWFSVRRWVSDADKPGALLVDEMGLGKTFTTVAAAILCK